MSVGNGHEKCPFCGRAEKLAVEDNQDGNFWIVCDEPDCLAEGPFRDTPDAAWSAWDNRG